MGHCEVSGNTVLSPRFRMPDDLVERTGYLLERLFALALPVPDYGPVSNYAIKEAGEIRQTLRIYISEGKFQPDDYWFVEVIDFTDRDEVGNELGYSFIVSERNLVLRGNFIRLHGVSVPDRPYPVVKITDEGSILPSEVQKKLVDFLTSFDRIGQEMSPNFSVSVPIRER